MPELLEFEEPVGVLLKEIEALSMLPSTPERQKSIDSLRRRADEIRAEIFQTLTPWPAFSSRFTMASPMRPRPIHPIWFAIPCRPCV